MIQIEDVADKAPQEQRFGSLFMSMEELFQVYEPFCANYQAAQDLVSQESTKLQKLSDILNPTYELPSMLIKPVQRICKYPLLLTQLIKATDKDWPHYQEMTEGLESIQRVTSRVNEVQRQYENLQIVQDLKRRVEDWKVKKIIQKFRVMAWLLPLTLFCSSFPLLLQTPFRRAMLWNNLVNSCFKTDF